MYKKIHPFCRVLKEMHAKENWFWFLFSASRCILSDWIVCGLDAERVEVSGADAEADQPRETARAVQDQSGAGDPELQGRGDQTTQDHLPAGERTRPLHQ